jgi:hypothetical protein
VEKNLSIIFIKTQTLLKGQTFLSVLIQRLQFAYFNGLLPCPLKVEFVRRVCQREFVEESLSGEFVKGPLDPTAIAPELPP